MKKPHYLAGRLLSEAHKAKISAALMGSKGHEGAGRPRNTPEVLWSKVQKKGEQECWPWIGYKNAQGYGRTWIQKKGYYAHRVIFDLANPGMISLSAPEDKSQTGFLLHTCDNPECCNPNHLKIATYLENNRDCNRKLRRSLPTGSEHYKALFDASVYIEIFRLHKDEGMTSTQLSERYNVSRSTIKSILHRAKKNA